MRKFVYGFVVGVMCAAATGVFAAKLVGENGYLHGWTVEVDGEEVCSDPYIYISSREVQCN